MDEASHQAALIPHKAAAKIPWPAGIQVRVSRFGTGTREEAIEQCVEIVSQPPPFEDVRDGDLLIQVKAAEVAWTDTIMLAGQHQHKPNLPYTPGMSYSGVVLVATPTSGCKVGDRVAIAGPDVGPRSGGKYQSFGGCATYAVAPARAARPVPSSWSFAEAACFAYGYDTAYHALVECGKVQKGEHILIHGASGDVGIAAVRMALVLGLRVTGTTRKEAKVDIIRGLGAHEVIVLPKDRSFSTDVFRATEGRGVDVVFDTVGEQSLMEESIRALRFGGRLLIVGSTGFRNADGVKPQPNVIPTSVIMMKGAHVIGCPAMTAAKKDRELGLRRVAAVTRWILQGHLPAPVIGSIRPLSKIKEALLERAASGSVFGASIVVPDAEYAASAKL